MKLHQEQYGRYGIACKTLRDGAGFIAWACIGPTSAASPIDEPSKHVWFDFGPSVGEAVGRLKAELDRVDV